MEQLLKIILTYGTIYKSLAENFNITLFPAQLLIDKNGTIVARYEGFNQNEAESKLDKLVS
jgi:hypothetical protein